MLYKARTFQEGWRSGVSERSHTQLSPKRPQFASPNITNHKPEAHVSHTAVTVLPQRWFIAVSSKARGLWSGCSRAYGVSLCTVTTTREASRNKAGTWTRKWRRLLAKRTRSRLSIFNHTSSLRLCRDLMRKAGSWKHESNSIGMSGVEEAVSRCAVCGASHSKIEHSLALCFEKAHFVRNTSCFLSERNFKESYLRLGL